MRRVYLAGAITGCSYKGCTEWREQVAKELEEAGFIPYSPMRGKAYLKSRKSIPAICDDVNYYSSTHVIFCRDKFDVMNADIIVANLLGAEIASIGTMMELAWGHLLGKFVVVVMEEKGNVHNHAFVREASSIIVNNLEEAVDYIKATFGQEGRGLDE